MPFCRPGSESRVLKDYKHVDKSPCLEVLEKQSDMHQAETCPWSQNVRVDSPTVIIPWLGLVVDGTRDSLEAHPVLETWWTFLKSMRNSLIALVG